MSLSYKDKSIDLLCKSMDWFLYDREIVCQKVKMDNLHSCSREVISSHLAMSNFSQ